MKRLLTATAILLAGTAAAAADNCTIVYDATNPTYAPDDSAITLFADAFSAFVGNNATCAPSFHAHSNTPNDADVFEVYTSDIRGDTFFPNDEVEITVKTNGRTYTETFQSGDNPLMTHYIGKEANGKLESEIEMEITDPEDPGTESFIDSIDYALAGTMTRNQAEASLVSLGRAEIAMVTHLDATSGLLTGGNMTLEGDNEVRVLGGVGSFMLGGNLRYNLSEGFSVLAGVSLIDQGAGGARYTGGLGAAALRFVEPGGASQRFFGEGGVDGGVFNMRFSRTYTDDNSTQTVTGSGTGGLGAIYLRGGMLFQLDESNEVVLSATAKQSFVGFGDYRETVSAGNLFAADLSDQLAGFTTVKLGADWTTALAQDLDFTAHLGVGTTMANQRTTAYILGGGTTTGGYTNTVFAEYGAGLAWHITPESTIEGFLQGSSGTNIGTHAQIGAAYRMKF
ncbi:MAG: hypothetical protein ABIY37_11900 [Devosia sp.]